MKIAIINYTSGGMSGGYQKYLKNVLPGIANNPEISSILCVVPQGLNTQAIAQDHPKISYKTFQPKKINFNKAILHNDLNQFQPDVIFLPVERYIHYKQVPVVNMLQNMEPHVPIIKNNPLVEKLRLIIQRIVSIKALKQSNHIIAISGAVYKYLTNNLNIVNNKISLIYHGINNPICELLNKPEQIPESWRGKFLFTAGSIRPARGLEDLLNSIELIPESQVKGVIIAGDSTSSMIRYKEHLKKRIKMKRIESRVLWTGNLSENELHWCYSNCFAFVMTSRVESFGMIAGEAMASGCVCISANNSCLPEIFGNCALYYTPAHVSKLTDAIMKCVHMNKCESKKRSQWAKQRASIFSWNVCVEKLVKTLTKQANSKVII